MVWLYKEWLYKLNTIIKETDEMNEIFSLLTKNFASEFWEQSFFSFNDLYTAQIDLISQIVIEYCKKRRQTCQLPRRKKLLTKDINYCVVSQPWIVVAKFFIWSLISY